ncbi:hypothetical protein BH10ACT11_BH10ACT11_13410 [soil metagenome]
MTPDDAKASDRTYELEELVVQPGTYFNPQTEVIVVVDDSVSIDQEVFNMEAYEGVNWVRISDEVPVDEHSLEEAMEEFQTHHHVGSGGTIAGAAAEVSDDEPEFEEADDLEPDPDPEDE